MPTVFFIYIFCSADKFYGAIKTGMGRKKEKLIKLGDEILKNVPTPDSFY
jgi:hypothetical protein